MRRAIIVLAVTALTTAGVFAQQRSAPPPPAPKATTQAATANALVSSTKFGYDVFKGYLTKAAEQMKEADYGFKPAGVAAEVRTFGQIIGHLADANAGLCAAAS